MSEDLFIQSLFQKNRKAFNTFPDKALAENFTDDLFNFLFGSYEKKFNSEQKLGDEYREIKHTFSAIVFELIRDEAAVKEHTSLFFSQLPLLYKQLLDDADAVLRFDPAAQSIEEVLVAYPGFYATAIYRLSNQLYKQGIRTLPRLLSEYAHSKTGIDIHPGASIGASFAIDHGTGIVVGETAVIGDRVKIYQGVTLGALNVSKEKVPFEIVNYGNTGSCSIPLLLEKEIHRSHDKIFVGGFGAGMALACGILTRNK